MVQTYLEIMISVSFVVFVFDTSLESLTFADKPVHERYAFHVSHDRQLWL